jgi:lysozyme
LKSKKKNRNVFKDLHYISQSNNSSFNNIMNKSLSIIIAFLLLFPASAHLNPTGSENESRKEEKKTSSYSYGIDISRYQFINWDHLDSSNLHFIICKASEGVQLIDPKFENYWTNIKPSIKKGAYHFFRPGVSGKEQAKLFMSVVNFQPGHILPVIDVEYTRAYHKLNPTVYKKHLKDMIREIEQELGVKPIIYTNAGFWNKYYGPHFKGMEKEYHLWIADYRLRNEPSIPKGWEDWTIWQHSCKGNVHGILNEVDLNICKVDLEDLIIKPKTIEVPVD